MSIAESTSQESAVGYEEEPIQSLDHCPAEARPSVVGDLSEIAREMWEYRELLVQFTMRDIRVRYKQSLMGFAWAIFMPSMIVLSGVVVKYAFAYVGGSTLDSAGVCGMMVKAVPWAFFVSALSFSTASLTSHQNLVTRIYFPREICPFSAVLGQAFDSTISALTVLLVIPFLGALPSVNWGWLLILAPTLLLFTLAVALIFSCGNLFFRDVKYITQILIMFGIFFTPVFYEPQMFGALGKYMMLNPVAPLLEGFRLCLVDGHNLLNPLSVVDAQGAMQLVWSPWYLVYSLVCGIVGVTAGGLLFHRAEFLFAEYI